MNKGYLKHRYGKEDISIDEMEKINSATLENKPNPFIDPAYKNYQFSYDDPRYSKFSDRISSTTPNKELVAQDAQGGGEILKNSLQGFGVNMAAGFVDNAGSTLAFFTGDALNMALGRTEKEYGNFLNNIAQDTREWGQEMFPIYNASNSMITGAYWGMQFSNLGTTAGIMAEAFAEQAIGGLVIKGIASLGKASKLASVINGIKKVETFAKTKKGANIIQFSFGMMQGVKEAHMNGLENYHGVYQEYIDKGRSEEEAEIAAKEAATKSYRIEIVPIALMNGLQWRAIGGKYNPYSRGGVQAIGVSDVTGSLFGKLVPKNAGKKTKIAFDYLGNMLSESIEEGWQETSQSIGHYLVDKERGYTEGQSVFDYIFTTELRDSMVGGALGGGFFRGVGGMFTSRATRGQRKQQEEIINKFIETTTERGNNLLVKLAAAEKAGNVQAAQQIKQELGYSNIENALLYDYMRNDDKLTAYNAQIESLREMKDIIDRGDQEGLELMGLIDETNENGVNEYQYLKDNLGDMIADAEQQKADFTKNLEFQMENFNEENVNIAQRLTQAQFMKRKNEQVIQDAERNITEIQELDDGILGGTEQNYRNYKAQLFALNNMTEELSPQLQKEKRDAEQGIKDIKEISVQNEESGEGAFNLEFNEEGSAEKSLINAHQRLAMAKNANHSLSTDIKDLKTGEGVQKFNDKRIKKEVESFRRTNDVGTLTRVQNILNNNERVKELYSETELETMKKAVEDKISKENSKTERQKSLERKLREQQVEEDRISKREEKENRKKREENKEDIPTYKKGDKITYLEGGKEKQGVITDDSRAVSGKYKIGTEGKQVSQKRIKGLTSEESTITKQEDKVGLTEEERITNILESNMDTIDENLEKEAPVHEKAGDVARKAAELANNIVDDSDLFFGKDDTTTITGVDDFIDSLAPAELDPNAKALRDYLKADAEAYLLRNPNATLADYIRSFIQNEEVVVADVDKLFYYYADGFYEAKNERYTDNLAEIKDVYKALLEPYNKVDVSKKALELFNEATKRETKNQELTEQEKEDAQKEIEKQTQKELLNKEGQVIEIDEFGNPVKYEGKKTAAPYVNVPFNGVPYKSVRMTDPRTGEVTHMFVKDENAISRNLISEANTLEGIKRAFMMDPSLAKEGVPIKAYIPSLNELMDDTNGFVVVTWTKDKDGVLESSTMPFSKWMNLEETTSYIDDSGNAVTQIVDKSPGSQRFLEKVPMFMSAEINGQEVQMGSVLHETDWWNERNIADFRNSDVYKEALNRYADKRSESAIEDAEKAAQAKQDAVIREGKKQTFEARKQIWENSKETWESGERTEVGMTISEVSDGLTLRIEKDKPKRSIREANNDLMVGLVLERDGESQFVISSDEGGSYDVLPKSRIYNSSILDETAKPGFALTAIPFRTDSDGNMMYLLQMVDTGYSAAQESLNYLHQQELKIKGIIEEYQRAFLKDKNSTETQKLRTQLESIFDTAKSKNHKGALNAPGRVGYGSALEKFAFQNLFRNYPRKNTKTGNLSASFNKDNISGKVSEIVVLDENGKPSVYKPNPDSNDNSVVQMLKENIYTDHDYIEIRDLQNQDPNATKKVANAQPRVKIEFNNEITQRQSDAKIKEAERLQKEAADKIRLEEEAKRLAEEQAKLKKENPTLEAKIADIERRRKEEYKGNIIEKALEYTIMYEGKKHTIIEEYYDANSDDHNTFVKIDGVFTMLHSEQETNLKEKGTEKTFVKDATSEFTDTEFKAEIDAKYDAELEALGVLKPEVKKISLTDGQKFTVLNNLFHKILGKFKTENVSRQDLARELRGILEESIADIKESNPELHAYLIKNKDSIIGLNQFKDSPGTLREAVQDHFNIENLNEVDAENLDMESTLEKNHSKTAQENDVRTSISSKLKRFFAGIPVNNQKRRGEAVEGIVEYMEIDDVFAAVQDLLADAPNNFEVLQQRIKEKIALNENEFGFLEHVLDRINDKNVDKQIQREILFKLNQTKNRMFFVYSKNNKGKFVLQVYDANSRQPLINIKTASSEQFKSSELVENLGDGNYKVNIGEAERSSRVMNLVRESKTPLFKETRESLADLGIYVEESTLEALHKQNPSKYKNNIDNLFKTFQANILELKNKPTLSFENKRENLLLNNTNNYLNNLLGEIIKVTFNIDQSMSVAGKTINAFSQPNFFSEQVRKLLSLKGEDLNEGSKHLAKQLLDNGYSKNSMTLQLLTERNKFDGSLSERAKVILSEMYLGYTSLDVLKRQNSKSEENSLSEVSPSDYDTTIMGFFGDMSKKIEGTWNNLKMRMASMTSPTLSDSSQMFLLNTVVLDLTSENLNVTNGRFTGYNEDVTKTLYEQLILPELTRAIEIKGTERDVIGNQLIYSIPAVNAVEVDGKNLHNFIRENQITEEYTVDMMLKDISDIFGSAINDIVHNTIATEVRSKINIDESGKLIGSWVDDGFIVQDKGAMKSEILDSEFLASKFKDGSALGRTEVAAWDFVINYYLTQSQIQMLFAGDAANYTKARDSHFQKNENGITDVANPKTLNGTQQEKSDVYVNIARNTSENLSKRLKALISPGNRVAFSQGKQYIQLMIEDSIEISSQYKEYLRSWYQDKDISKEDLANIDYIIETAEFLKEFEGRVVPKEGSEQHIGYAVDQRMYEAQKAKVQEIISNLKNKYPDIAGYLENASTDAQEYTTWQEHLDVMYDMGKLSTEQYESVKNKLQLQSQGKFDASTLLTVDEKVVFQPMKPLHSGMYFREMNNGSSFQEFVYVKSSSFPLIPEMTRNINLDNLRKNMENLQEKQDMPVRASYQTANKVGGVSNPMNINQLLNNNNLDITEGFSVLDRDNFSIQQEKPFKTDKNIDTSERDQVGRGTQIEKILLGNGINKIQDKIFPNLFGEELIKELGIEVSEDGNISGEDLHTLFTDISMKEQALKREEFLRELDIDPNDFQLGSVKSMESLQSALSKRLPNRQDKEILALKYFVKNEDGSGQYYTESEIQKNKLTPNSAEFSFPIWLSPNSRKFESVLNSMVTNEFIKLKLPGNSFPVASEIGFRPNKTLSELTSSESMGIVYTDSYNGQELLPERTINGITYPAQVLIASKFRRKVINPITKAVTEEIIDFNTPEYINPETGRIDPTKVPREALELFSFRIPTSAHQSGSVAEIVGFLPHSSGDLMVVPNEHTTKIGEDYDIDTRYTYSGNYIVGEDGSIRLTKKEDVVTYPKEELDDLYNEYNEYKQELQEHIQEKNSFRPSQENQLKTEIASTQFLINILETKRNPLAEDAQEIQALKEEMKNLEASLESYSEESITSLKAELKTLHDEFVKNKNLRMEEFLDARRQSSKEIHVLENEIINLYKSLYLSNNNEVQKLITTTINTEMADTTAKLMDAKINSSSDQNSFSIFGYEHQKSIMRLGSSGKLGIGVHSNWVVWNGLVQQSKSDIGITGMNMQIGYFNSDGKLGNARALKPNQELIPEGLEKNYIGFQPRMLSEINMENQNSATDNQKLQIMGKRNENKYTINVFALMNNLGFDKDVVSINGKNVEMLTSSLFINQPILRRYVELRENQSSVFAEFTRSAERDIQQKLKEEFGNNVDFYINEKTGEISDMLTDEAMEKASLDMTGQTLYDSLVNPTDNNVQWAVLQKFIQLQEHATNVNKVIQMMNIDKGLGISYFNILAKKNILVKEMNSTDLGISNVETLFGEQYTDENGEAQAVYEENTELVDNLLEQGYIKIGVDESTGEVFLRKPNSANSAKLLNSISMGYYLWGNIFPFENRYFAQQIDDILGATNKQDRYDDRTMETRYDILVSIRDYMYSLNNLDLFKDNKSGDINDERRRLLIDNKETNKESLAGYLVRLKKEATTNPDLAQLFNKAFFRNLEFVINKNEPSLIKYSINNTNSLNKNLPHTELSRMSESQELLPAFNGDENYTHEKLVDDLLRYSLLTNVENGAIGFRNYIPMKVFQKHNIDNKLTALANMQVGGGRFFNILYNGTLKAVTSFIGNESYNTDNQGDYMEIPNNIASNPTQMFSLNRIVDNVNRTLGENTLEINSNNEVRINRPTNDIDKGRFVRQFYQHNPQHAQRINHEQAGIKRNEVQNANVIDALIETDEEASKFPDYVSMMDNNKQLHLYELATEQDYSTESKGIRYNRINKLGGFGVNEFNPNSEVRTSIFESNNVKEITPGERALSTKNRNVNKGIFDIADINSKQEGITVAEAVELFSQEKLDLNNPEVVRLKNILDNLMDFVDPNTRVYKESLTQGPGRYTTGNNIISLDVDKMGPKRVNNLFRVFVEEVVHSISAREIETYINTRESTISVSNDEVVLDAKRIVGRTSAPIEKLLQLYKKSVETLIDQEITVKNGAINKQEAFANILNRDPKLDTTGYRIQNLHEFVAGIMSDATFRNQMNKIEYRNTGQTILKQFADFIGKILSNISDRVNNSITEQTIASTIELINSIPTDISPRMNPLTRLQKLEAERRAKALLKSTKTVEIKNNSELSIVTRENYLAGKLDDNIIAKFLATGDATIVVNGQANTDLMNLRNEMREDLKKKKETKNPNKNPGNITVNGITLNNDQQIAYDDIMDFLNDPTRKTHSLIGYAGTGKTTLLNIIEKGFATGPFDNMIFTSPTHRANAVIRLKNPNATVHTLHSLLGLGIEQDLETFDISAANFKPKGDIKVGEGDVIVIDESSMINDKLYDMINKVIGDKGAKVLFVGDDAQIKPVKQSHQSKALTSTEMSSQLNIVERANNNSLLEESMSIREKGDFTYQSSMKDNKGIQFMQSSKEFLTKAFDMFKSQEFKDNPLLLRILSGTNAKVAEVNAQIRQALFGKDAQDYMAGDIIMGYANWKVDYKTKVPKMSNGGDYVVLSSKTDTQMIAGVEVKGHTVELQNVLDTNQDSFTSFIISKDTDMSVLEAIGKEYEAIRQEGIRSKGADAARAWARLNAFKNSFMTPVNITYKGYTKIGKTLDYGYAHTIHKSQGGTYKYSFVMDNTIDAFQDRELRSQLKYVAATRAEEGTFVLTNKEISEKGTTVESLPIQEVRDKVIKNMQESMEGKTAEKHLPKEIAKVKLATQFIGQGVGSTQSHKNSWGERANTGKYTSQDVVMLAANGKRGGRFAPVVNGVLQGEYKNIQLAMEAGASFVADTESHINNTRNYNIGEIELQKYLSDNGYSRTTVEGVGLWTKSKVQPTVEKIKVESLKTNDVLKIDNGLTVKINSRNTAEGTSNITINLLDGKTQTATVSDTYIQEKILNKYNVEVNAKEVIDSNTNSVYEALGFSQENNTEAKIADIKRRRQEELNKLQPTSEKELIATVNNIFEKNRKLPWKHRGKDYIVNRLVGQSPLTDALPKKEAQKIKSAAFRLREDIYGVSETDINEINAKYDAEIDALEAQITPPQKQQTQEVINSNTITDIEGDTLSGEITTLAPNQGDMSVDLSTFTEVKQNIFENCR